MKEKKKGKGEGTRRYVSKITTVGRRRTEGKEKEEEPASRTPRSIGERKGGKEPI